MTFFRKKRVFALLLMMFLLLLAFNKSYIGKKLYPIYYQEEIQQSAKTHQLDPFLIAAVIRAETNFRHQAESHKGAIGIMQLMPETAAWIVETSGANKLNADDLLKPEINIHLGSWYLRWLISYYEGNLLYAIAAYNAGQGNVNKWKQSEVWNGTEDDINQIPFGETRHYVQRVLYYYKKYSDLYEKEWSHK